MTARLSRKRLADGSRHPTSVLRGGNRVRSRLAEQRPGASTAWWKWKPRSIIVWAGIVTAGLVLVPLCLLLTFLDFPDRWRLVFESETVSGEVISAVEESCSGRGTTQSPRRCTYRATVRFTTKDGESVTERMNVSSGTTTSTSVRVRYERDHPTNANAEGTSGVVGKFVASAIFGPLLSLAVVPLALSLLVTATIERSRLLKEPVRGWGAIAAAAWLGLLFLSALLYAGGVLIWVLFSVIHPLPEIFGGGG